MRNDKQFNTALNTAIQSVEQGKLAIQDLTIEAIQHAVMHGDTNRLLRIREVMPQSFSQQFCNRWQAFMNSIEGIRWTGKGYKIQKDKLPELETLGLWFQTTAKEQPEPKPFDSKKAFEAFMKKMATAQNEGLALTPLEAAAMEAIKAAIASR